MSLSKTHLFLLSTGSTQEDLSRHNWKIVDWDVKNQIIKQTNKQITLVINDGMNDIKCLSVFDEKRKNFADKVVYVYVINIII